MELGPLEEETSKLAFALLLSPCEDTATSQVCNLKDGPQAEPNHTDTRISDFQPPKLREINFRCL